MEKKGITFHKDYKGSKINECKCTSCGEGGCGYNCEYQEREQSNPKLDHYQGHDGRLIKKEYEFRDSRFFGCDSDFLMDFYKENRFHWDGSPFIRRQPKSEYGLIDFSEGGGIHYNPSKIDILKAKLAEHGRTCKGEEPYKKSEFIELLENN